MRKNFEGNLGIDLIDFVVILYEGINTNVEFLIGFPAKWTLFSCGNRWNLSLVSSRRERYFYTRRNKTVQPCKKT